MNQADVVPTEDKKPQQRRHTQRLRQLLIQRPLTAIADESS
jgi:hypothetical protein